ncbi:MAG TPA: DUF308 domain-containing protein [Bryobacteraceae bacterium]|nr:DUF308 domain-containing protein [Bryobacteraceae bacterium]
MNGTQELRENWGWILTFGCLMLLLGIFAVAYAVLFTIVSVFWIGAVLIVAGVLEAIYAIRHRGRGHLVWYILEALLAIVVGLLLLRSPVLGALALTLLMAAYFILAGVFKITAALVLRLPFWGWTLLNGVLSLALGVIVWGGWPVTAFWVLGLFIGINLIFSGFSRILLAFALRHHPMHPLPV